MATDEVDFLEVEADEKGAKLINPGKSSLTGKAVMVEDGIEEGLASAFGSFAVALVLSNVRHEAMVEADFAGRQRIEATIGVEGGSGNRQAQAFDSLEGRLQLLFEVEGIVMIARDNISRGDDVTVMVSDRQDIGRFRFLASLISHRLTAFLGNGMAAIQVQHRQVQVVFDELHTMLPHALQAAVAAPFAKMVIHRPPTDFALRRVVKVRRYWQLGPLAARMQPIQHVIEYFHQRDFAHVAPLRCIQIGQDIVCKLFVSYTYRYSAHFGPPLARFSRYDALFSFLVKSFNEFMDKQLWLCILLFNSKTLT